MEEMLATLLRTRRFVFTLALAFAFLAPSFAEAGVVPPTCALMKAVYRNNSRYAISCTRSKAKQAALRAYFIKKGRPGQAGKNSNHVKGCACDFSTRRLKGKPLGRWYDGRGHTGNHMSNTGR